MDDRPRIKVYIDPDLEQLIPDFLENRRGDIGQIQTALANRDFGAVRIIGHNLKGLGGGYGFEEMTQIGALLEKAAKDLDEPEINELSMRLDLYLSNIEVVFQEL